MREQDQQRPHLSRAQQNGGTRLTPFRLDSGKSNSRSFALPEIGFGMASNVCCARPFLQQCKRNFMMVERAMV